MRVGLKFFLAQIKNDFNHKDKFQKVQQKCLLSNKKEHNKRIAI